MESGVNGMSLLTRSAENKVSEILRSTYASKRNFGLYLAVYISNYTLLRFFLLIEGVYIAEERRLFNTKDPSKQYFSQEWKKLFPFLKTQTKQTLEAYTCKSIPETTK